MTKDASTVATLVGVSCGVTILVLEYIFRPPVSFVTVFFPLLKLIAALICASIASKEALYFLLRRTNVSPDSPVFRKSAGQRLSRRAVFLFMCFYLFGPAIFDDYPSNGSLKERGEWFKARAIERNLFETLPSEFQILQDVGKITAIGPASGYRHAEISSLNEVYLDAVFEVQGTKGKGVFIPCEIGSSRSGTWISVKSNNPIPINLSPTAWAKYCRPRAPRLGSIYGPASEAGEK